MRLSNVEACWCCLADISFSLSIFYENDQIQKVLKCLVTKQMMKSRKVRKELSVTSSHVRVMGN